MNMEELFNRYPYLKTYLIPLGLGGVGLVLIVIGLVTAMISHPQEQISIQNSTQSVEATSSARSGVLQIKEIVVDVEGEVAQRGIYHLSSDSRVVDALQAAGGLSENADRDFVEKHVNLAQKLIDGYKLYIPKVGENNSTSDTNSLENGQTTDNTSTININTASADQLDSLPGVGQVIAGKIINGRPYTDMQDLLTKKIISAKVFDEIKEKISIY